MSQTNNTSSSKQVMEIVAEVLDVDVATLSPTTSFRDLKLDFFDVIEILMKVERTLPVSIHDYQAGKFLTVADLISFVDACRTD